MKKYLLALIAIMGITYTGNSLGMREPGNTVTFKNDIKRKLYYRLKFAQGGFTSGILEAKAYENKNIPWRTPTISSITFTFFRLEGKAMKILNKSVYVSLYDSNNKRLEKIVITEPTTITFTEPRDGVYRAIVAKPKP